MKARCIFLLSGIILLSSCSSTKNTGGTRWYHSFNTRYNVFFNGSLAYDQAFNAQLEGYTENYSEMIMMYPVSSLPKDKETTGGAFDKAIEKAVKAIKMHSIQTKPERKQGKRNDPSYRAFLNRKEYNPFLYNAWMMMAQSQLYNGDFLEAASSFSYISRLYETQPEIANTAKLYKARCYDELTWYYDADNIFTKLPVNQLTKEQKKMYSSFYADHLIKQKQYAEAIPYLKASIQSGKNKLQRTREKYLLGQLYTATNQKELAYKTFGQVTSSNAPYILELSAKIRQTEVYPGGNINSMSKKLNQMAKNSKNTEYLDQIYYALGNVYMTVPDTAKAIESYELGVEKSARNGIEKALNQIRLGDIYFDRQRYVKAQPNYSEALAQLKKGDDAYPRVSKRSEALDALVVHVDAVELQDSLQRLSRMTEDDRMAVINKIIEDLIKKEKEEKKKAQQDEYLAQQSALQEQMQANRPGTPTVVNTATPAGGSGEFYFYNPQVVAIGKSTFQQKWGRRNLEDDWRRRNKSSPLSSDLNDNLAANDAASNDTIQNNTTANNTTDSIASTEQSTDPHDPQFYLQQIPMTPEELVASDLIIANGLFNMGVIYKDMLEDNHLSLETFQTLDTRFPDNENKQTAYYYMYLIYWQDGNMEQANLYKAKIREGFPESDLAIAMADPDYEYNQKMMESVQDSLYQQTYTDYLAGNTINVRKNFDWVSTKYNQSKLMPKFILLNALSFAQTNEPDTFKVLLKGLIDKYPKEDVTALASDMMKGFQRGLLLASSGDKMLAQGSLFNIRFSGSGDDAASDSTIQFSAETAKPYVLLLLYPKGSIDENMLLYTVAGYNFGSFMINDFGLEKSAIGEIGLLRITGFSSHDEVMQYLRKIQQPDGYAQDWGQTVLMVPISEDNYSILMKGKSVDEYMTFFENHFAKGNENLIAQWRLKQAEEKKVSLDSEEKNLLSEAYSEAKEETHSSETVVLDDTTQVTLQVDSTRFFPADTLQTASTDSLSTKAGVTSDEVVESVNKIYNEASDKINDVSNTLNAIASDPIRGIANLFKRKKTNNAIEEFAKQQEQEDKAQQMQLKQEQDKKDKAAKILAAQQEKEKNDSLKKKAEEDKAALKAKQQAQSDLAKKKETDKKQKEADRKRLAKEKKEAQAKALKKKKEDQKAKEKALQEKQKQKAKEREALLKQREAERKQRLEQQKKQVK